MTAVPVHQRIQQLRAQGAARIDPSRMAQIEAMARRLEGQPDAVRALLRARMEMALQALEQQLAQAPAEQARARAPAARQMPQPPQLPRPTSSPEMQSVIRFRRSWANGRAHDRVAAAAARRPAKAGPINSHMLVLQSLDMMRALPGDYLRRFLTHVETLQWLEAVQIRGAPGAKPARPRRTKAG